MAVIERLTRAEQWVDERSTWVYTKALTDERGQALASSGIATVTLTVYDAASKAIVNAIDHVNVKNTGRGALTAEGVLTLTLAPADTVLLLATTRVEPRRLLIQWTWAAGAKAKSHEVEWLVRKVEQFDPVEE